MREMRETLRATFGRVLRLENRRGALRQGALDRIAVFESKILGNARQISVFLPPGYDRGRRRYPVLYMQDGQNLFEPQRAFVPGQSWKLDHAAEKGIAHRTVEPVIIVGIDHAGSARVDEYTHAADYGRMLIEELKPMIDARYRTDAEVTAIGGSSLGGLAALFLGLTRPELFTRLAAMSPSVWWDHRSILDVVDRFTGRRRPRIWLDVGGREGGDTLRDVRTLRDRLFARGWAEDELGYREDRRGDHSERAWARRARPMLEFLFPAG